MNAETLVRRFAALPGPPPAAELRLRSGTRSDYAALAAHHYRAQAPATFVRVLVLDDPRPTVVGRYLQRTSDPRHRPQPAAVLVESLPALSCRMRDAALPGRYGPPWTLTERARLLNAEVRCISRVVVDPSWRGLGLAVMLVRQALATASTPYTEALAAMGRVNPFFVRAGMTAYPRPPHAPEARLLAALARVNLTEGDLTCPIRWAACLNELVAADRRWLENELARWARQRGSTRGRGIRGRGQTTPDDPVALARHRLALEPVYHLHQNLPR